MTGVCAKNSCSISVDFHFVSLHPPLLPGVCAHLEIWLAVFVLFPLWQLQLTLRALPGLQSSSAQGPCMVDSVRTPAAALRPGKISLLQEVVLFYLFKRFRELLEGSACSTS